MTSSHHVLILGPLQGCVKEITIMEEPIPVAIFVESAGVNFVSDFPENHESEDEEVLNKMNGKN